MILRPRPVKKYAKTATVKKTIPKSAKKKLPRTVDKYQLEDVVPLIYFSKPSTSKQTLSGNNGTEGHTNNDNNDIVENKTNDMETTCNDIQEFTINNIMQHTNSGNTNMNGNNIDSNEHEDDADSIDYKSDIICIDFNMAWYNNENIENTSNQSMENDNMTVTNINNENIEITNNEVMEDTSEDNMDCKNIDIVYHDVRDNIAWSNSNINHDNIEITNNIVMEDTGEDNIDGMSNMESVYHEDGDNITNLNNENSPFNNDHVMENITQSNTNIQSSDVEISDNLVMDNINITVTNINNDNIEIINSHSLNAMEDTISDVESLNSDIQESIIDDINSISSDSENEIIENDEVEVLGNSKENDDIYNEIIRWHTDTTNRTLEEAARYKEPNVLVNNTQKQGTTRLTTEICTAISTRKLCQKLISHNNLNDFINTQNQELKNRCCKCVNCIATKRTCRIMVLLKEHEDKFHPERPCRLSCIRIKSLNNEIVDLTIEQQCHSRDAEDGMERSGNNLLAIIKQKLIRDSEIPAIDISELKSLTRNIISAINNATSSVRSSSPNLGLTISDSDNSSDVPIPTRMRVRSMSINANKAQGTLNPQPGTSRTARTAAAGTSGTAAAGTSGTAAAGTSGTAAAGTSGTAAAGTSGTAAAGTSGTAAAGTSGTAAAGTSGTAAAGTSGTAAAGNSGTAAAGTSGTAAAGTSGTAAAGTSGTAAAGTSGTAAAGTSGTAAAGTSGTAAAGTSGTAAAGTSGTAAAGTSGTAAAGTSGTAAAGTSGTAAVGISRDVVGALVFKPTIEEFNDPMAYFEKIMPIAAKYGLCKVVAPDDFKPACTTVDTMQLKVDKQYIARGLRRWGPVTRELCAIRAQTALLNAELAKLPSVGGIEVDLVKMFHAVQRYGGLTAINKEKWLKIAEELHCGDEPDLDSKLDLIYRKWLLPYDVLTELGRQEYLNNMEEVWRKKNRKMLERAMNPLHRQKRLLAETDASSDEESEDRSDPLMTSALKEVEECVVRGSDMTLSKFQRIAQSGFKTFFPNGGKAEQIERSYWKIVEFANKHVCVNCASIDTGSESYGFTDQFYHLDGSHRWNLKNVRKNKGNVLRHLGPLTGLTVPTLHFGMVYSTKCWHRDPHGLPWMEYMHEGSQKIWYGISDEESCRFRIAVENLTRTSCQNKSIWLPPNTTMIPPQLLMILGVSLSRVVQNPGEYVIVFPKSYSCSISTGYTVSESVYFATYSWVNSIHQVFQELRDSWEPTMFSLEHLLLSLVKDPRASPTVLQTVNTNIVAIFSDELNNRVEAKRRRLVPRLCDRQSVHGRNTLTDNECQICRKSLYLSRVKGVFHKSYAVCISHAIRIVADPKISKRKLEEYEYEIFFEDADLLNIINLAKHSQ